MLFQNVSSNGAENVGETETDPWSAVRVITSVTVAPSSTSCARPAGHKLLNTIRRYIRHQTLFRKDAAAKLGL
jgi:hypothetical protein